MADKKDMKTKIWVYAVVLFTSAFIVLLLTAYSQIKLNKNLVNYKNQVSSQKSEKKKYQLSFENAQAINNKLNDEKNKLAEENKNLSASIESLQNTLSEANNKSERVASEYGKFSNAQIEYLKGNVVDSALLLKQIDISLFDTKTRDFNNIYTQKVYEEAGKLLYEDGYKLYKQGKYRDAIDKFSLSRRLYTNGAYSDNCLYYLARSLYRLEDKASAVEDMRKLIAEYPQSPYLSSAKSLIRIYDNSIK